MQISPFVYIGHMRGHFGVIFQAKSNCEVKSVVQLYKSADKCADFSITLTLVYKIGHMRGHFGVVFQAKSNGEVSCTNQPISMQISP